MTYHGNEGIESPTSVDDESAERPTIQETKAIEITPRGSGSLAKKWLSPEGESLTVSQLNCRSIRNKVLEFWNLIDTYNPDIVIGTESWLNEDVNNAEVFMGNYITIRRDRYSRGGGVFICVKSNIEIKNTWADDDFEIVAVEIISRSHRHNWEILGVYRAPNDDSKVLERLTDRAEKTTNPNKHSIIGGDLNLPRVDWKGKTESNNLTQLLVNRLIWDNGYSQVTKSPTRGDALLDVYLVKPDSSVTSCSIVQGISDHHGVLLEIEWEKKFLCHQPDKLIPVYSKTDVISLQTFLNEKYLDWARNGSSVEHIWINFKNIIQESVKCFVPHKIRKKKPDPEYYTRGIKKLKIKVRKAYIKRKLGTLHMDKFKQLSLNLLSAKKRRRRHTLNPY